MSSKPIIKNESRVNFYLNLLVNDGFNKIYCDIKTSRKKQIKLILPCILVILAALYGYAELKDEKTSLVFYFLTSTFILSIVTIKMVSNLIWITKKLNNFRVLEMGLNEIENYFFLENACHPDKTLIGYSSSVTLSNDDVLLITVNDEMRFFVAIYNEKIIPKQPHLTEVLLNRKQQEQFFRCLKDSREFKAINEVWR